MSRTLSWRELHALVSRLRQALQDAGVGAGDRVAGFVANCPETVAAMLAAASLGAIWSSCSPDFGVEGVLDRFGQIEPVVLFVADRYRYGGRWHDCLERAREIAQALPSLRRVIVLPYDGGAGETGGVPGATHAGGGDRALRRGRDLPRAAALLPSSLRDVLLGHHGQAQVHRARGRRHAAAAAQGARAALRRAARRPRVLLHDLRLDDVELAGGGPRQRRHAAALRRLALPSVARRALRLRRGRAHDALRHLGEVHRRLPQGRPRAARDPRSREPAPAHLHRLAAVARGLRLGVRARRSPTSSWPRSRAAPTSCPASFSATRWRRSSAGRSSAAASAWPWTSSTKRGSRCVGERASWSARGPSRRCRWASGTIQTQSRYRAAYFARFPGVLVPRRLRRADAARRHGDPWPLRCGAQSRRRAHRDGRDLSPGGGAGRGGGVDRHRAGVAGRRADRALRAPAARMRARRRARAAHPRAPARPLLAAPRARQDPAGGGHPAHAVGQDRRAGGPRRGARAGRARTRRRWPIRRRWRSSRGDRSWRTTSRTARCAVGQRPSLAFGSLRASLARSPWPPAWSHAGRSRRRAAAADRRPAPAE